MNSLILVFSLLLFLCMGIPVVFALLLSCAGYLIFLSPVPMLVIAHRMVGSVEALPLIALPLFILAADIMNAGKISEEILNFAKNLVGHIRGSLGHVNVIASIIFAGMSGSIAADTAGLGRIEIPMMEKAGFDRKFAIGVTGASSIIGPIMPPSIQMILYAMITEQSVGRLFVGGAIPGVVMGLCLMVTIYIISIKRNYPVDPHMAPFKKIFSSFKKSIDALLAPVILLGGIISGIFTPTEAAVVAVIYAFIVSFFIRKRIKLKDIIPMVVTSAATTALILIIMGAAAVFGWLITLEQVPILLRDLIVGLTDQKWVVLILLNLMFLIAGCFFDICAIILVFTPMVIPILQAYGIDMVHWGVVEVLNVCIGFLTPPFGVGLYVLSDISKLSVAETTKGVLPFIIPLLVALALITYIPAIVLWLPSIVFG